MVVPGKIRKVYRFFLEGLPRSGQVILMKDFEGFEAEVYFTSKRGDVATLGTISIVIFCPDQSLVSVEVPRGFLEAGEP